MIENVTGVYFYGSTVCNVYNVFINSEQLKRLILTDGGFYTTVTTYGVQAIHVDDCGINIIIPLMLNVDEHFNHPKSMEQFRDYALESLSVFPNEKTIRELMDIITSCLKYCTSTDIQCHPQFTRYLT